MKRFSKIMFLGLLFIFLLVLPAFAAIDYSVPAIPEDAPYKDHVVKLDGSTPIIAEKDIFNKGILDYETTIEVEYDENGDWLGHVETQTIQNVVLVIRWGDDYQVYDAAQEQRRMYQGDTIEGTAKTIITTEARYLYQYPSRELVSINGEPWQETEWADYFIQAIKTGLSPTDTLLTDDRLWDIFMNPKYNNKAEEVYEGGEVEDPVEDNGLENKDYVRLTINSKKVVAVISGGSQVGELNAPPYIKNGRTMIPLRGSIDKLGATLEWNGKTKQVTVKKGEDTTVILTINSKTAKVNGKNVTLDQPAEIKNGRTFVPIRFASESLGYTVVWEKADKTVTVSK